MGKSRQPLFTMATGTLQSVSHSSKLSVTLFLLLYIDSFWCQQFVFPFKDPADCSAEEFFDISALSCAKCGADQRQSTSGQCVQQGTVACVVNVGFFTETNGILPVFKKGKLNRLQVLRT